MRSGLRPEAILCCALLAARAHGAVVSIPENGLSGTSAVLDFESYTDVDVLSQQLLGLGVTFAGPSNGWRVEPHAVYGSSFSNAATSAGAGANGLQHESNGDQEIVFDPPVRRVGFQFGSNVSVSVPVTFYRGGDVIGTATLSVTQDELPFFGFEATAGIDRIVFHDDLVDAFVSQLDNLRFERITVATPGDFSGPAQSFESFTANSDVMTNQLSGEGVTFASNLGGGGWAVEPYSDYSDALAAAAIDAGAGANALFHQNLAEEIHFDPPVARVGFLFGSNVNVQVPITFTSGSVEIGRYTISAVANELAFFGFEDPDGIDEIAFGEEINGGFVSQLDDLHFDALPEPADGAAAAAFAIAVLGWRRGRARSK